MTVNNQDFPTIAHRAVYFHLATFPPFVPVESEQASARSQEQMHAFLHAMLEKLYEEPGILGLPAAPDGALDDWMLNKHKPEVVAAIRTCLKKLADFAQVLIQIGEHGVPSADGMRMELDISACPLSPVASKRLARFGVSSEADREKAVLDCKAYAGLFPGWKLLSAVSRAYEAQPDARAHTVFLRGIFDLGASYAQGVYARLASEPLLTLLRHLDSNGYAYSQSLIHNTGTVTLDYYKSYGGEEPLKGAWAERTHGGLSVYYEYYKRNPLCACLRVPYYKELLAHFDEMDDTLKQFVLDHTKKCDNCRYCVQTDKAGKRPLAVIFVTHGKRYGLCPMFPGFGYVFRSLSEEDVGNIRSFLCFVDCTLKVK